MTHNPEQLEILISRVLDGECSADERSRLERTLRADAVAQALYDDYRRIDEQAGAVLRAALGRAPRSQALRWRTLRLGQFAGMAAAACLAMLIWLSPPQRSATSLSTTVPPPEDSSWFAGRGPAADELAPAGVYDRPAVRVKNTQRDYIMIPGARPGEYLLISVDRVRTRMAAIHQDF
ncbi:hypothetical protein RAS1_04030 [Phycisphaerae bacterium RAS1]|nr:hypothetical protein RAS1_04030 [Phycisphaerae bacterium RAS1]